MGEKTFGDTWLAPALALPLALAKPVALPATPRALPVAPGSVRQAVEHNADAGALFPTGHALKVVATPP